MKQSKVAFASILALLSGALMGASCGDKKSATGADDYDGVGKALDSSEGAPSGSGDAPGAGGWEVPGVDTSKLSDTEKKRFAILLDKLPSPCGKAHSLRTSVADDQTCKRALFAARYVSELVAEDLSELETRDLYENRYRDKQEKTFQLQNTAHQGPEDAKVVIVEFFDHACSHCAMAKPMVDRVLEAYPNDVVVYYKNFPLSSNPNSVQAAVAALAAGRQGKFGDMHAMLFQNQRAHDKPSLRSYAEKIGLDMAKFEKDFADPALEKQVDAERGEGISAGLQGTPTFYINGREYTDPLGYEFMKSWVDEELAVNR